MKDSESTNVPSVVGSSALEQADYWWFTARSRLLSEAFSYYVPTGANILDVGSSNSPSVDWLKKLGHYTPMDLDPRGLPPEGIVGSVTDIPFEDSTLDVVTAFDVIEHISDDHLAVSEIYRVLKPGGFFLLSVPAYEWAWSSNDVHNAHYRRYTRKRIARLLRNENFVVRKNSHAFTATFPLFTAIILLTKFKERKAPPEALGAGEVHELPETSPLVEKILLGLSKWDEARIGRCNLPFGSSIFVAAQKPV